ncbi:MAG: Rrf2 family transcriptional regulator [Leptospiraceae bacterium]|nr:Rrf2 family transcriptional regulator [Leptospiraceae bacterium]
MTSRFTIAVHILSLLDLNKGESKTSEELALSVNTNPVVIRKILGALKKAGFIQIQMGQGGGASLSLESDKITLKDIYQVFEEKLFVLHPNKPNAKCICGKNIQPILSEVFSETEQVLVNELSHKTIYQISSEILKRAK